MVYYSRRVKELSIMLGDYRSFGWYLKAVE